MLYVCHRFLEALHFTYKVVWRIVSLGIDHFLIKPLLNAVMNNDFKRLIGPEKTNDNPITCENVTNNAPLYLTVPMMNAQDKYV